MRRDVERTSAQHQIPGSKQRGLSSTCRSDHGNNPRRAAAARERKIDQPKGIARPGYGGTARNVRYRCAVRFARRNVKAAELKNVAVEAISVDSFAELLPKDAARVLVDPPRVGLSNVVRRALIEARPRHITYVSCHAPTLARDLREMLKVYRLDKLSLLDMFPQTGHMEVVAQLVLREPGK